MAFIDWVNLDLHTGHPVIDEQLHYVLTLVDQAYMQFLEIENNTSTFDFVNTILSIQSYLDEHFETEEALMKELKYKDFSGHRALHNEFKCSLNALVEKIMDNKVPNIKFLSKKMLLLLRDLLINHIEKEDKMFVYSCYKNPNSSNDSSSSAWLF